MVRQVENEPRDSDSYRNTESKTEDENTVRDAVPSADV